MNLNRDYDVLRKNYEELLARRESMRIATAAEADADKIKIQIVDPPQVPQNAVEPKRALLMSGVLLAALAFGVGLALLLAQFDQSFHTLDELRDLGLPVAGSISMVAVTSPGARAISIASFTLALILLFGVYSGLLYRLVRIRGAAVAMANGPDHLAERLAARLGGVGGLGVPPERGANPQEFRHPAGSRLPMPPPVRADQPAPGTIPAHDDVAQDSAQNSALPPPPLIEADRAVGGQAAEQQASGPHASEQQPPPPVNGAPNIGAPDTGALVLDRPGRRDPRQRPGDELAPQPGVDLDTMVPAPLTLDLVTLERAGMVVGRKARTRISEEFRVTVGQILRSVRGSYTPGRGAGNLVMVTSARPGEGKSFSSLNLAGSIAQHTQREVLLVDVDAKQNALSDQLGIGDRPGLIDLALTPNLRIEDTLVRTIIPNLSFMPVGVRRVDSLEGGAEGTVARPITSLIERLGRRFPNHIVILDAPPCLSTSDPSTLAPFVGQVVMVVEAERTQRSEVLAALDLIKACPTITLMLNKIRVTTSYTFGAYHYFGSYS